MVVVNLAKRLEGVVKDRRTALENRDVWEVLLAALEEQDNRRVLVHLWLIPTKVNEAEPITRARTFEEEMEAVSDVITKL